MTPFLDIRTLSLVMGAAMLVSAFSMVSYSLNRKTYRNFIFFTAGIAFGALSLLLVSLRLYLPDEISILVSNVFIYLSITSLFLGFRRLEKGPIHPARYFGMSFVLSLGVVPWFTYIQPSTPARIVLVSFTAAICFSLMLRILFKRPGGLKPQGNRLLMLSLVLVILVSAFRGGYFLFWGELPHGFMDNETIHGALLLLINLLHISFVMGVMHLNAQQLEMELVQNQKEIIQNEAHYRLLVERSRQGLVIARDNPTRFVFVSEPMSAISGYAPEELMSFDSQQLFHIVHRKDRDRFIQNFRSRLKGDPLEATQEYRIIRKDGSTRWVETISTPIEYEGHPAVHAHFLDITQRKQAEQLNDTLFRIASAVTEASSLEQLFHAIHLALGDIMDVTNFFIALSDIEADTLYFPYHVDISDDDFEPVDSFDRDGSLTGLVFNLERPVLLDEAQLKKRAAKNGVWGPVPKIWLGAPLIVRDQVIGVVAVQSYSDPSLYTKKEMDILSAVSSQMALAIDRQQTQDKLRENEAKYRHLFAHAPAGICEVDIQKNRIIRSNAVIRRYSGYSETELQQIPILELLHPDSRVLFRKMILKLADRNREVGNREFNVVRKDGGILQALISMDMIRDREGRRSALVVIHDISRLKQAEKEKTEALKLAAEHQKLALIGRIAGKMAHDFNNVLGIIMGNIELLLLEDQPRDTRDTLEMISSQTLRGKNLTRNLVAFAKNTDPRQTYFQLNDTVTLAVSLMKKELSDIDVRMSLSPRMPDLLADAGMMEHLIINLIQNAVHALSRTASPRISFTTRADETHIHLEITDNGCGIPEEHLDHIFEPSFTLKGNRDTRGVYPADVKGTGYGLANVRKYVHQHRGEISTSSTLNEGTTVRIQLPVIHRELTDNEKQELKKGITTTGGQILLVEDEPDIAGVQERILSQAPYDHEVTVVSDGRQAMDCFDRRRFDLVSLDYMLPGNVTGMAVYRHIRTQDPDIPVVFISGNMEFLEEIKHLKKTDPNLEYLSKPCPNATYVSVVNALMTRTNDGAQDEMDINHDPIQQRPV